ncbi:MAG: penicillin-binding protein 1A [Sedimenticola sp.]
MKWLIKFIKVILWLGVAGGLTAILATGSLYLYLEPSLPSTDSLKNVHFQVPLRVYSQDAKLIAEFGEKRRIPLNYNQLPKQIIEAFLSAEDDRFFEHPGVDYHGLLRAAYQLLLTGKKRQGGSTITMQVARNFYLSREKTFLRKINEIFLSFQIEHDLSKEEILTLYLNKIYMGNRAYGVGAAAQVYYNKSVDELSLAQIAMIAGLPKAPSKYNPLANSKRAVERRNYVLDRMTQLDYITQSEKESAIAEPVTAALHTIQNEVEAPYIAEMVRSEMVDRFGAGAYTNGYTVHTTIDSQLQTAANNAVRMALQAYDKRHGYRGISGRLDLSGTESDKDLSTLLNDHRPVGNLLPAIVTATDEKSAQIYLESEGIVTLDWEAISWAKTYIDKNHRGSAPVSADEIIKAGDLIRVVAETRNDEPAWRLAQIPAVEGALIALNPDNGAITSLVGGYDFYHSKFNRATQAKRQPGSGFKAIIYSAALEAGYTAASLINDAPVVFDDPSLEGAWRPENYSGKFFGPTRLRYALTKSRNLVSIRLLRAIGVKSALQHAERFGFNPDDLPQNLSLALGSGAVTPIQMASAYAILANGGYRIEPHLITQIVDDQQQLLFQANSPQVCESCTPPTTETVIAAASAEEKPGEDKPRTAERAISAQNHYLMNSMMRDVITHGTGRRARSLGRNDLAGKTGTTNDQRDAWFNGFNRSLVAIAWVGFDSSAPLGKGEVGGTVALPAWIAFMKEALRDVDEVPLKMPDDMVSVRIDPKTGKRASVDQSDAIFEVFRSQNAPTESVTAQPATRNSAEGTSENGNPYEENLF